MEPTHPDSNPKFDTSVFHLRIIILSLEDDVSLITRRACDFMNLKIMLTRSFRCARRSKLYVHVIICVLYHVFREKKIYNIDLEGFSCKISVLNGSSSKKNPTPRNGVET
jgi:hypothetical protein